MTSKNKERKKKTSPMHTSKGLQRVQTWPTVRENTAWVFPWNGWHHSTGTNIEWRQHGEGPSDCRDQMESWTQKGES